MVSAAKKRHRAHKKELIRQRPRVENMTSEEAFRADWERECEVCGATPVVNATGLCGPCTFGEAETIGGNW